MEIRSLLESDKKDIDLEKLEQELRDLEAEKKELEKRKTLAEGIQAGTVQTRTIDKFQTLDNTEQRNFESMERDAILSTPEYRSAYLKRLQGKELNDVEKRALTTAAAEQQEAPVPQFLLRP